MRWIGYAAPMGEEGKVLAGIKDLFESNGGPPSDWKEVRSRLERRVWRVPAGDGAVFVKLQLYQSFRVRFRYALRPAPTLTEARKSMGLLDSGLTVPAPLLHGESGLGPWRRRSILVTRGLPGLPAVEALKGGDLSLARLARLVMELRERGLYHPDLHLNNLLFFEGGLSVLDLQSLRFGKVDDRRALSMAVKLGSAITGHSHHVESAWLEALVDEGHPEKGLTQAYGDALDRMKSADLETRVRRCLMRSSEFSKESWRGHTLHRRRSAPMDRLEQCLGEALALDQEGLISLPSGQVCLKTAVGEAKRGWTSLRRMEVRGDLGSPPWALLLPKTLFFGSAILLFDPSCSLEEVAGILGNRPC